VGFLARLFGIDESYAGVTAKSIRALQAKGLLPKHAHIDTDGYLSGADFIGGGQAGEVYAHPDDPSCVVKLTSDEREVRVAKAQSAAHLPHLVRVRRIHRIIPQLWALEVDRLDAEVILDGESHALILSEWKELALPRQWIPDISIGSSMNVMKGPGGTTLVDLGPAIGLIDDH
jgi:hypothetical protein